MKKIRIALAGVGNCASALIQGVEYYRNSKNEPIGVAQIVGKYAINDIEFVLGFDVHKEKVDLSLKQSLRNQTCWRIFYTNQNRNLEWFTKVMFLTA